jgi:hypothetical protein
MLVSFGGPHQYERPVRVVHLIHDSNELLILCTCDSVLANPLERLQLMRGRGEPWNELEGL